MFIIAECGLWSVLVSNDVVYNSVLLYEMPWVMAQPRGACEVQPPPRNSVVQMEQDPANPLLYLLAVHAFVQAARRKTSLT